MMSCARSHSWLGSLARPMTVAPASRASWTAITPTPPAAPATTTGSPEPAPTARTMATAVVPATLSAPATSHGTAGGFGGRSWASATTYSAWLARVSTKPITSSPGWNAVTPGPTAAPTPARSLPSPDGNVAGHMECSRPSRILASPGLIPAALTWTSTWPAPGSGCGTSTTLRTSIPPYSSNRTALGITASSGGAGAPPSVPGNRDARRVMPRGSAGGRSVTNRSVAQVGQHGQDPAVVVVGGLQVELVEDRRGVLGHRPLGDDQALGDGRVRPALGHQRQHLALAPAEGADRAVARAAGHGAGQQAGDHLGIHGAAARRHPVDRGHELRAVEHPVLEQVADAAAPVGQQFPGVQLLDVLGQHQDRQAGDLAPGGQRGPQALVGEGGREPDVHHRHVRRLPGPRREQVIPVVHGRGDVQAVRLQHPGQAVPQQEEVFGDDNAHGISRVATVGPPSGLFRASIPSKAATRRSMPLRPVPPAGSAPPLPSSVTSIRSIPRSCRRSIQACRVPACLDTLASSSQTAK